MPWPVFPRHSVAKVLGTLIDESIRIDQGIFSVPVPKEQFPDYYDNSTTSGNPSAESAPTEWRAFMIPNDMKLYIQLRLMRDKTNTSSGYKRKLACEVSSSSPQKSTTPARSSSDSIFSVSFSPVKHAAVVRGKI